MRRAYIAMTHMNLATSESLLNEEIYRSIDLSTQLVVTHQNITFLNDEKFPVKTYRFYVEPEVITSISILEASSGNQKLNVREERISEQEEVEFWEIDLKSVLKSGERTSIQIETVATHQLVPYPSHIRQGEAQLVKYVGNSILYSPYHTKIQSTTVNCGSDRFENFSVLETMSMNGNLIIYGPFEDIAPFTINKFFIHYVNNEPFLTITNLERVIEVSHWGNIAVEETIELAHKGAILKGSFSRYNYKDVRKRLDEVSTDSSVSSYLTFLPASAKDIYYRDDIGNISTSHVRALRDSVEMLVKFRFPLFGGWKVRYTIGYNVPTYEYLYSNGEEYSLRMRVLDHVYNSMIVDELITKVILPEHCTDIWMHPPYSMVRLPDGKHFSYLDITGRPVIIVAKNNLVEHHIQDFELEYTFPSGMFLMEPLILIFAYFSILILVLLVKFLDFSIEAKSENTPKRSSRHGKSSKKE
ncbi:Dolichyl-diphosphooligosaccharide--protein glycosyltransferase subunit 1 [Blattella germanica]|nr:Dolichyl-diphosphooligosaccharide--protein glycosyltransferase subunit 1 [Blattella germanica]